MDCRPSRTKDPDEWLKTCPDASRSICEAMRDMVFRWEPDLTESINTNMLCFTGRKRVCALGAYQRDAEILFFRGSELPDPSRLFNAGLANKSIRNIRLSLLEELPSAAFRALLRAAVNLDARPEISPPPPSKRKPWPIPAYFTEALQEKRHRAAAAFFEALAPTYRQEYVVWLTVAKRPETRDQRLEQTLAALASGLKWKDRKLAD